jgi:hypothetical protein
MPPSHEAHAATTRYNDVRDHFVLVRHDPAEGAMRVLLRVDGAESPTTRAKLEKLGFVPTASRVSVSLKRPVSSGQLGDACKSIRNALGDEALFDLGASFDGAPASILREAPRSWGGRFLLHVGGTRRCVVFDASADDRELMSVIAAARDDYWANDFHPATE